MGLSKIISDEISNKISGRVKIRKWIILIIFIAAITLFSAIFIFTSCTGALGGAFSTTSDETQAEIQTFEVKRGNIAQEISVTGSVDSESDNSFNLQVSGQILEAAETGNSFSKGDVLVKVDDTDAANSIVDVEKRLEVAKNSLAQSRVNYQSALDSNHIAIQLVELDRDKAELSVENALDSLSEASKLADISSENAKTALEISQNSFNTSVVSVQQAEQDLEYARAVLDKASADSGTTDEEIMQLEDKVVTAAKNLQKAELSLQSSELSLKQAEASLRETSIQSNSQEDSAKSSYEQSQLDQSSTYWSTLENLQNAEKQIQLAALNMEKAALDVEVAEVEKELITEELDNYVIRAPYGGIVVSTDFRTGEETGSGTISIISNDFIIKAMISESDVVNISAGKKSNITFDAYPDIVLPGNVEEIMPIGSEEGNIVYYEATISFKNEDAIEILYGMTTNIYIIDIKAENVLYVPLRAVYKEEGKSYVDVLVSGPGGEDDGVQNVKKTEITTGASDYYNIEVISGLNKGDIIVTSRQ